jgi:hypothetical protein
MSSIIERNTYIPAADIHHAPKILISAFTNTRGSPEWCRGVVSSPSPNLQNRTN